MPEPQVLILGAGIAGMETALTLAEMGYKCLLVERENSIGGKMILLSKVFPTLDCASCIATPKMAATARHPKIKILVSSELKKVVPKEDGFEVEVVKNPTYVNPAKCTGCGECEKVCPVPRPDQFNAELTYRRAIHIPFPQAVPKKAAIEKRGQSPCSRSCPLEVRVHALVALSREGRYEEAIERHLERAPFLGALSILCEAPCEKRCTLTARFGRGMAVKALKRYLAENFDLKRYLPQISQKNGKKIAIVGEGPLALGVAYYLALFGFEVSLFGKKENLGGFLRNDERLPKEILEKDLEVILGVGIKLETRIPEEKELLSQGFDAIILENPSEKKALDGKIWVFEKSSLSLLESLVMAKEMAYKVKSQLLNEKELPFKAEYKPISQIEIPPLLTEEELEKEITRCLDCAGCCECYSCVKACPASAIDFNQKPQSMVFKVKAIVIATGFRLYEPQNPLWGYRAYPNVITGMQLERLLAPTRPYNAVLRPSDGKVPGNIGIILCVGSRSLKEGSSVCSRICCMYSLKQAQLLLGAIPFAEVTIYYIDLRAFGKGYEEFLRQTQGMGVNLVQGRVARLEEAEKGDIWVYYEDFKEGKIKKNRHDLVVLATGALAEPSFQKMFPNLADDLGFAKELDPLKAPGVTEVPGIFVVGSIAGPKDIPDTVAQAQAVAINVVRYLKGVTFDS